MSKFDLEAARKLSREVTEKIMEEVDKEEEMSKFDLEAASMAAREKCKELMEELNKKREDDMRQAKFWLIVDASPSQKGDGTRKKYSRQKSCYEFTDYNDAYKEALERVRNYPEKYPDGVMLCCPAFLIKPKKEIVSVEVERLRDGAKYTLQK